ncbi:MAG: LpqB family beta-propeller domain-containing protein [Actinomycetota bacterium]
MAARRWFAMFAPVAVVVGLFTLTPKLDAARERTCAGDGAASDRRIVAVANGRLVDLSDGPESCIVPRVGAGVLRHVASEPGEGTAVVVDEAGADTLVVIDADGSTRIAADGEVHHPAWSRAGELVWVEDMRRVVVRSTEGMSTVALPRRAIAVFAPRLVGRSLFAVVAERGGRSLSPEDASLDNLWRYDLRTQRWSRVTDFTVHGDRWSAIRTPVVAPDGSLLFVRVHGRWKRTRAPSFELWRARGPRARDGEKVADLPGEMFLAGFRGRDPLWNVLTRRCGDWELFIEELGGLRSFGCGAVQVDPVDAPDPDLTVQRDAGSVAPSDADVEPVVLVGDFSRRATAASVARQLGGSARIVTNDDAPAAVRPGAYAVAFPADPAAPSRALREVRGLLPKLASKVYLAAL